MPYLVEILLPVTKGLRARSHLDAIRDELMASFGGVTMQTSRPAEGLWEDNGDVERDLIVVAEVMTGELDREWWIAYRKELEARFHQDEVVIRAMAFERL